ncbi:MAG: PulJ/GspJ family protein [Bacillota bacterium]
MNNNQAGFTLIEIMMGLAIMSILVLVITGGLSDGLNFFRRGEQNISANSQFKVFKRSIAKDVRQATDITVTNNGEKLELETNQGDIIEYSYKSSEHHLERDSSSNERILMQDIRKANNPGPKIFNSETDSSGNLTGWVIINLVVLETEEELNFAVQSKFFQD